MAKKTSLVVALEINKLYARLARAAAKEAEDDAGHGRFASAQTAADQAEVWARRAGGNALCWGL